MTTMISFYAVMDLRGPGRVGREVARFTTRDLAEGFAKRAGLKEFWISEGMMVDWR